MTESEAITRAADKYRDEGYAVTLNPDPAGFPAELRDRRPALLATKNGTSVVVEVWGPSRLNDLPPTFLPPGWQFDVVVLPKNRAGDVPGPGPAATSEFTYRLLAELEEFVPKGAIRARFLLAWSAAESAMRVAARRAGIEAEELSPRQLMWELAEIGVLSRERFELLQEQFAVRNRLVHGVPTDAPNSGGVDALVTLARELVAENTVSAA